MEFKLERLDRDPAEYSERAFLAASRRKDRDFNQRMESLQKASDLHFERTGRRFEITPTQVAKSGPLMELSKGESKRQREVQRFQPYSYGKTRLGAVTRNERTAGSKSSQQLTLPSMQIFTQSTMQQHTQTQSEAEEHEDSSSDFDNYSVRSTFTNDTPELDPGVYSDGSQNSDSKKFVTTQPEGYVNNKDIELSPKSKSDIPSIFVEPKSWKTLCLNSFNAFDELMARKLFDPAPSHKIDTEPEPSETIPD